jgi:hypothetical protein
MKRHAPQPIVWTPRAEALAALFVLAVLCLLSGAR